VRLSPQWRRQRWDQGVGAFFFPLPFPPPSQPLLGRFSFPPPCLPPCMQGWEWVGSCHFLLREIVPPFPPERQASGPQALFSRLPPIFLFCAAALAYQSVALAARLSFGPQDEIIFFCPLLSFTLFVGVFPPKDSIEFPFSCDSWLGKVDVRIHEPSPPGSGLSLSLSFLCSPPL